MLPCFQLKTIRELNAASSKLALSRVSRCGSQHGAFEFWMQATRRETAENKGNVASCRSPQGKRAEHPLWRNTHILRGLGASFGAKYFVWKISLQRKLACGFV